ncbi:hypothetical protein BDV12DRAFT_207708 [Aspergillus spectabilis]
MGRTKKSLRDVTRLSGRPLSETLSPSPVLVTPTEEWVTSPDLTEFGLPYTPENIQQTTSFLMANPGLNSTVLFRADILFDSQVGERGAESAPAAVPTAARDIPGFELTRTVVRRLIPRNRQLDQTLDQTCHFYGASSTASEGRFLVVHTPHVSSKEDLPYYHPRLRSLALLYEVTPNALSLAKPKPSTTDPEPERKTGPGTMSIHILPYTDEPIQPRLERTLTKLLDVQIRITRGRINETQSTIKASPYAPIKDNLIPRSRVQDTYSRLKIKYAADLSARWVEDTEPSKHVFEDLGVAAFLVELWRDMYGFLPVDERTETDDPPTDDKGISTSTKFPGFVDIACGNGVLVYILLSEGYPGWGFDARRRKTWSIFPSSVQAHLTEEIYIPKPFADIMSPSLSSPTDESTSTTSTNNFGLPPSLKTHTATPPTFPKDVFIISNHADELTLWTPLLAILLNPTSPPPFLAIPCCSHSLSGARYRFPPQHSSCIRQPNPIKNLDQHHNQEEQEESVEDQNPQSGSLLALRQAKFASQNPHSGVFNRSTYGSLTEKLILLSREVGYAVTKTLLRIPSTRNIGVLGVGCETGSGSGSLGDQGLVDLVPEIVERECAREGGVDICARDWVERARGLRGG